MKALLVLSVVLSIWLVVTTSGSAQSSRSERQQAKSTWYHANGYIKAIGKNAKRTIYHPNHRIKHKWKAALSYLMVVRHKAWIKLHPAPAHPAWLTDAFLCIHRFEGSWTANTGNGYHGGLQMDSRFMATYGAEFVARWGGAENWPVWAQIEAAARGYAARGFSPWPNTARACGLI